MKTIISFLVVVFVASLSLAQQAYNVTFTHDSKTVFGTFTVPPGTGPFPTIIINPGSGANDRDGTIPMVGANIACLYPGLLGDTLRPYKQLSDGLVAEGFAVLRYDKLEYTYQTPASLGTITFHKLWLPVESAINYVKTRPDVDTTKIILIGHSEGSTLIPIIARGRNDIRALISIAGARTPFDSILAYQIVNIARTCHGDTLLAKIQAQQILDYYNLVRTNMWNGLPPLFGVPASVWYDYILATDSVAILYNQDHLCTLFLGMGLDINVPPAELISFQNEITITDDFWSMPGLVHYMTSNNDPHVSSALIDTIVAWLASGCFTTSIQEDIIDEKMIQISPNPFYSTFDLTINNQNDKELSLLVSDSLGHPIYRRSEQHPGQTFTATFDMSQYPDGIYFVEIILDGKRFVEKIIKR
jgi:dienelactone hydrolase